VPACIAIIIGLLLTLVPTLVSAEPIPVKYAEGVTHGFLVLRGEQGPVLAHGELMQAPHADGVQSRMTFRFTDGSLYDETVTFSQKRVFRLLAYKLVQRGPSFPEAADVTFDRAGGRYHAKVGTDDSDGTLDVPDDLHNGMTGTLLRNLPPGGSASGHMYAFTPKPRLMRTTLRPEGEDRYHVGDLARTAVRYLVSMDLVGLTGVVATVLGKEPADIRFWITTSVAPSFVKFEGSMFLKGPRWRIELGAPRWPGER
jgi:hypothetical protein